MKDIFKKGDRVFDIRYGWGTIVSVNNKNDLWPIEVVFDDDEIMADEYTFDGRSFYNHPQVLSFTEYTLQGFSQERPEELPKIGQVVWVRNKLPSEWIVGHFFKKDNGIYHISYSPSLKGWNTSGIEIKTINPYENEQ
jgi:hypothetical protein